MKETPVRTLPSLVALIRRSEVVGEGDKAELLEMLPRLAGAQLDLVWNFFLSAEKELGGIRDEKREKQSRVFDAFLPKMSVVYEKAHKDIYRVKGSKDARELREGMSGVKKVRPDGTVS